MLRKIILAVLLICTASFIGAMEMKCIKKVTLSQEKTLIGGCYSFAVTGDDYYLITDYKIANFKIFNPDGTLAKEWGRRGPGPNEFFAPLVCSYIEGNLAILDFGKQKLFILKREGKSDFSIKKEIFCSGLGVSMSFMNENKMLIGGYKERNDERPFSLYILDLNTTKITFLMPSEIKYGLSSYSEYKAQYRSKPDLSAIGVDGFCDWNGDYAFYTWEGDLRIIKINMKSDNITYFGKKTDNYIKPRATPELIKADRERNPRVIFAEKDKFSYIYALFANTKYVVLIYHEPSKTKDDSNTSVMIQFYTPGGKFLSESRVVERCSYIRAFLKKDSNELYLLTIGLKEEKDEIDDEYKILKYNLVE
jgi:hypothetical protein